MAAALIADGDQPPIGTSTGNAGCVETHCLSLMRPGQQGRTSDDVPRQILTDPQPGPAKKIHRRKFRADGDGVNLMTNASGNRRSLHRRDMGRL